MKNENQNLNEEMKRIMLNLGEKSARLLLHACCAPCSSSVLERLALFDVTPLFYNPNIDTQEEYFLRAENLEKLAELSGLGKEKVFIANYVPEEFLSAAKGLEKESEGGNRCKSCIALRMRYAADFAAKNNYDFFCSTLSVSPHKDSALIHTIGKSLEQEYGIKYLPNDFKKEDGFLRSGKLSKQYSLYRQDYCGCVFSKNTVKKQI